MVKPHCSNFRIITAIFWAVRIFGSLWYYRAAVEAFRKFLENTKSVDIIEVLSEEDCWEKLEDKEDYPNAINVLTRYA